jgi:hypothetical protein
MWYVCFIGCLGVVLHKRTELNRRDPLCAVYGARRARKKTEKTSLPRLLAAAIPFPSLNHHCLRHNSFLYNIIIIIYETIWSATACQGMKSYTYINEENERKSVHYKLSNVLSYGL